MRPDSIIQVRFALLLLVLVFPADLTRAVVVDFAPADLSADGRMAVGSRPGAGGGVEAVRWTAADGAVVPFGAFTPTAMSADGSVVVGNQGDQAVRWTEATGVVPLNLGGTLSNATGVSADGSVVTGTVDNQAYRWTVDGGMLDLGDLPGNTQDAALGISADGSTIVGQSTPGFSAFRWTAMTGIVEVASGARATAVSADGSVVVGLWGSGAFRWTARTGLAYAPVDFARATDVSADGSLVVGTWFDQEMSLVQAFIWDETNGFQGHWVSEITAVSSDGSTIIGVDWAYYLPPPPFWPISLDSATPFEHTYFIVTIPDPVMLPLLACARLLLRRTRHETFGRTTF